MTISYGDVVTCQIDPIGDLDAFRFNGSAGDMVVVQAASNSSYPCIEVFDPAGVQIASQCSFRSARGDVTLASSGQHTLLVTY